MTVRILVGHVLDRLAELPDESVHCVVTSPPFWGLRDYGVPATDWGNGWIGSHGLEPNYALYVENEVRIFCAVWRVLRSDGVLFLNLGDSYATGAGKASSPGGGAQGAAWAERGPNGYRGNHDPSPKHSMPGTPDRKNPNSGIPQYQPNRTPRPGLKPKDLVGIPWRVALALQDDGWWLRQDIIWSKPNPMPESVQDRCTKAHEYLFLLTKSERYHWDADAISEAAIRKVNSKTFRGGIYTDGAAFNNSAPMEWNSHGNVPNETFSRNRRSVWTIATAAFPEAHFATFPPKLVEPCILAGCPEGGTVLDPFLGAGTTALVADRLGRDCIGIELNEAYAAMAERRLRADAGMFAKLAAE